jgi:molecular chaperone GrpE
MIFHRFQGGTFMRKKRCRKTAEKVKQEMKNMTEEKEALETVEDEQEEMLDSVEELPSEEETSELSEDESTGKLHAELKETQDKFLRLAAEYDNFRKRTIREREDFHKYAVSGLIEKLLPVLDSCQRGVAFNEQSESLDAVKEGLVKVNRLFHEILEKEGLSPIEERDVAFDVNRHMAVFQEENGDVEENTVLDVFERGYMLKEKVIRPAKVKVSKMPENNKPEDEQGKES